MSPICYCCKDVPGFDARRGGQAFVCDPLRERFGSRSKNCRAETCLNGHELATKEGEAMNVVQ